MIGAYTFHFGCLNVLVLTRVIDLVSNGLMPKRAATPSLASGMSFSP